MLKYKAKPLDGIIKRWFQRFGTTLTCEAHKNQSTTSAIIHQRDGNILYYRPLLIIKKIIGVIVV